MRNSNSGRLAPKARRSQPNAGPRWIVGAVIALVSAVACRDIGSLTQANPGALSAGGLFAPSNAALIVNSSQGDFECAYNNYIVVTGLFVDELADAINFGDDVDIDRRTITPANGYGPNTCEDQQVPGLYVPLSAARASNDRALEALEGWTDAQVANRSKLIATAAVYSGYSFVLMAEALCSAAIDLGPELTDDQLLALAKSRFDTAVVAATRAGDTQLLSLARLGRARTLLDMKNSAGAAVDAALIPAGFEVDIGHDAVQTRRQNLVYVATRQQYFFSVEQSMVDLYKSDSSDQRIAVDSTGQAGSTKVPNIWAPRKDPTATTPQALAKYSEAQLILAENALNTSNLTAARDYINVVRTAAGVAPFAPAGGLTAANVKAQLIEERRREFFLEGHRLGDQRRFGFLLPAAGTSYTYLNGTYSAQSCFPLPDVERINNPNIGH
jgi:hypothetical protein